MSSSRHPVFPSSRHLLLGLVTALIAARPLVTTPDPGRLPMSTATGHLWLTLGWFLALVGWAVWNAWAAPGRRVIGAVGVGLLATAGLVALRAAWAPYQCLAWRVAWDWASCVAAFVVVRQLVADQDDARGLLAVILATSMTVIWTDVPQRVVHLLGGGQVALPETDLPIWMDAEHGNANPALVIGYEQRLAWSIIALTSVVVIAIPGFRAKGRKLKMTAVVLLGLLIGGVATWPDYGTHPLETIWQPALRMVVDHPGTGVGPGHYDRFMARYALPTLPSLVTWSPGSYLELAASCGLLVTSVLTAALVLLAWQVRPKAAIPHEQSAVAPIAPRWDIYLGGVAGLLIGFVLQVGDLPPVSPSPIRELGFAAAIRSPIWFLTLASAELLLRGVRASVTLAGVAIIPLILLAAGDNFLVAPAVAQTFWVLAAVGLSMAMPPPPSPWAASAPGRLVPLLAAGTLAAGFVVLIFLPATLAAAHVRQERLAARAFESKRRAVEKATGVAKAAVRADAVRHVERSVLPLLALAIRANPADAGPLLEAVPWWLTVWELGGPAGADENAVLSARAAQARDPEGVAGYLAELHVRLRFAERSATKRKEQFEHAERLVRSVVEHDPAREARLRYQVTRAYFAAKDERAGREAAASVLKLNENAPGPRYRLRDDEREQLRKWLKE
jgi:hypothetical protein